MARKTARNRIRPLEALRAIRALLRDPDDTARVFDIIRALSGNSGQRSFRRFASSEVGAHVLAKRSELLPVLSDRESLMALPPGTLGRTYGEFMGREALSADGLVAASKEGVEPEVEAEAEVLPSRNFPDKEKEKYYCRVWRR